MFNAMMGMPMATPPGAPARGPMTGFPPGMQMGTQMGMPLGASPVGAGPGFMFPGGAPPTTPGAVQVARAAPPGGPKAFKVAAPNYAFKGAEDSVQAMISNAHIGVVLMGAACLVGGCIGMAIGENKGGDSSDESDDEKN